MKRDRTVLFLPLIAESGPGVGGFIPAGSTQSQDSNKEFCGTGQFKGCGCNSDWDSRSNTIHLTGGLFSKVESKIVQ